MAGSFVWSLGRVIGDEGGRWVRWLAVTISARELPVLLKVCKDLDIKSLACTPTLRSAVGSGVLVTMSAMALTVLPRPWSSARMPPCSARVCRIFALINGTLSDISNYWCLKTLCSCSLHSAFCKSEREREREGTSVHAATACSTCMEQAAYVRV